MSKTDKPWKPGPHETLTENPWFSVRSQDVASPNGQRHHYYTIHCPRPAVGVVPCRGNEILLLYQYRFIIDQYVWAIPSGGVGADESPEKAAARELEEETGYRAGSLESLVDCFASYGCSDQRFLLFRADELSLTGKDFDRNEVIDIRWFSMSEVTNMILANAIVDNLSLTPLLMVLLAQTCAERR